MKKLLALGIVSVVAMGGAASAQADYQLGGSSAAVDQTINVVIPERVGLHLTKTSMTFTLEDSVANPITGVAYPLATTNKTVGPKGCLFIQKDDLVDAGASAAAVYAAAATYQNYAPTQYPAVIDADDNGVIDTVTTNGVTKYLKGGLLCLDYKVVQKFSNDAGGFKLDVRVKTAATQEVGKFFIADYTAGFPTDFAGLGPAAGSAMLDPNTATAAGPTIFTQEGSRSLGWQDDYVVEGIFFDGTEQAGNSSFVIEYKLSNL